MLIHRNPPTKDEFILLKAGQWISATVQINDAFTLSDDGLYVVEYVKPLMVTPRDEMNMMTEVNINEVIYIDLEGARHLSCPVKEEEDTPDFIVNIESCSSQVQVSLEAHLVSVTISLKDTRNFAKNSVTPKATLLTTTMSCL